MKMIPNIKLVKVYGIKILSQDNLRVSERVARHLVPLCWHRIRIDTPLLLVAPQIVLQRLCHLRPV
jgi:hypothetical protein